MSAKEATARITINKLLEETFAKFVTEHVPESPSAIPAISTISRPMSRAGARDIIDQRQFTDPSTVPFSQLGASAPYPSGFVFSCRKISRTTFL